MNVLIRKYKKSDTLFVIKLFDQFQDYLISVDTLDVVKKPSKYAENYLNFIQKDISKNNGNIYLAIAKNEIVGLVVAIVAPPSKDPGVSSVPRGFISDLYIKETHRGKGIGIKLMEHAERYLKSKKCNRIFLTVFAPNENAHAFYKKIGYKDCDMDMIKKL